MALDANGVPVRRGKSTNLTLDSAAADLLRQLASDRTMGRFLSALIFAEAARREERERLKAVVLDALSDRD